MPTWSASCHCAGTLSESPPREGFPCSGSNVAPIISARSAAITKPCFSVCGSIALGSLIKAAPMARRICTNCAGRGRASVQGPIPVTQAPRFSTWHPRALPVRLQCRVSGAAEPYPDHHSETPYEAARDGQWVKQIIRCQRCPVREIIAAAEITRQGKQKPADVSQPWEKASKFPGPQQTLNVAPRERCIGVVRMPLTAPNQYQRWDRDGAGRDGGDLKTPMMT